MTGARICFFIGMLVVVSIVYASETDMISHTNPLLAANIAKFKKEIGYENVKNTMSDSEIVLLDWPKVLEKFTIKNDDWVAESPPVGTANEKNNAEISAYLTLNENAVDITIYVISDSNLNALSIPFDAMSLNSSTVISLHRLIDGPGEMYLTLPANLKQDRSKMVYKNIYIDIDTPSDLDVRVFADYLYQIMSKAVIQRNAYQIPDFRVDISASTIKLGDEFTVTLNAISKDSADWNVEMRNGNWPMDDLEVVTYGPNHHTFKALKPGPLEINFDIFNTKTLMSYLKKVHINILE